LAEEDLYFEKYFGSRHVYVVTIQIMQYQELSSRIF